MSAVAPAPQEAERTSGAQAPETTRVVKLTVALPAEAIQAVEDMAARTHKTKTQVLREAIALKKFVEDELAHDGHFLVERGGVTREIVFTT